ncbi:hypothetical protein LEN26_004679, partial [Aphanomyces euteiches]
MRVLALSCLALAAAASAQTDLNTAVKRNLRERTQDIQPQAIALGERQLRNIRLAVMPH